MPSKKKIVQIIINRWRKKGRRNKELEAYEGIIDLSFIVIGYRLVYYFYFFLYYFKSNLILIY